LRGGGTLPTTNLSGQKTTTGDANLREKGRKTGQQAKARRSEDESPLN
jgi:hypothetical protein